MYCNERILGIWIRDWMWEGKGDNRMMYSSGGNRGDRQPLLSLSDLTTKSDFLGPITVQRGSAGE